MQISSISRSGSCTGNTYTIGPMRSRCVRCAMADKNTLGEGAMPSEEP
jgi:hypothetical protein